MYFLCLLVLKVVGTVLCSGKAGASGEVSNQITRTSTAGIYRIQLFFLMNYWYLSVNTATIENPGLVHSTEFQRACSFIF